MEILRVGIVHVVTGRRLRAGSVLVGVLCGLVAVTLPGCGYSPDLPPVAEVSGTVTLDGNALPRGTVQFVPDDAQGTSGAPGVGSIDSNGRYEISTAGVKGAIVGKHKVGVVALEEFDPMTTSYAPSLIPERYNDANSSGLAFEVKAGEENVIDLKLTSGP